MSGFVVQRRALGHAYLACGRVYDELRRAGHRVGQHVAVGIGGGHRGAHLGSGGGVFGHLAVVPVLEHGLPVDGQLVLFFLFFLLIVGGVGHADHLDGDLCPGGPAAHGEIHVDGVGRLDSGVQRRAFRHRYLPAGRVYVERSGVSAGQGVGQRFALPGPSGHRAAHAGSGGRVLDHLPRYPLFAGQGEGIGRRAAIAVVGCVGDARLSGGHQFHLEGPASFALYAAYGWLRFRKSWFPVRDHGVGVGGKGIAVRVLEQVAETPDRNDPGPEGTADQYLLLVRRPVGHCRAGIRPGAGVPAVAHGPHLYLVDLAFRQVRQDQAVSRCVEDAGVFRPASRSLLTVLDLVAADGYAVVSGGGPGHVQGRVHRDVRRLAGHGGRVGPVGRRRFDDVDGDIYRGVYGGRGLRVAIVVLSVGDAHRHGVGWGDVVVYVRALGDADLARILVYHEVAGAGHGVGQRVAVQVRRHDRRADVGSRGRFLDHLAGRLGYGRSGIVRVVESGRIVVADRPEPGFP